MPLGFVDVALYVRVLLRRASYQCSIVHSSCKPSMASSSSAHEMPAAAPKVAASVKRALRKRKVYSSLQSGSASFGSAHSAVAHTHEARHLGRELTEAEQAENVLATPWPMKMSDAGPLFHQAVAAAQHTEVKIVITHSRSSPTGS